MNGQERIAKVLVGIVVDDDGTEGVPAFRAGQSLIPLVVTDPKRLDHLVVMAQETADQTGKPVQLLEFTGRGSLQVVEPKLHGPSDAKEGPEGMSTPFRSFDEPVVAAGAVHADGVIVSGTLNEVGEFGLGISYMVGDHVLPPVVVTGQVARDLLRLGAEALETITQQRQN